jgi:hypothetical protein
MRGLAPLLALLASSAAAQVSQHIVLLEPADGRLSVRETFFCTAAFQAFFPEAAKLEKPLPKVGGASNVYRLACPPPAQGAGEGRVDVSYTLPTPDRFSGKVLYKGVETRLVTPAGIELSGDGIEAMGSPPNMGASIYRAPAQEYAVTISEKPDAGSEGPGIERIQPRIYSRVHDILGLSFLILLLGFFLLYRRTVPR